MAPAMPCKTCKKNKHGETRSKTNDFKSKFACILEASESTRLRMGESLPNYHEDHIAGKGDNSLQHCNLVNKFIPMPQAMKFPQQRQQWTKNGRNLEKISAWNLTKVRSKKEVIDEARTKGAKVHFASLMDMCHLKNAELEAKHQKYKDRVVLRGDIVKDDSGSYAVFTEQGSSALQMTAAKVMDIISRLPGCDGQAADAVSAYTQVKMADAPKLLKIPNRNVQTCGFVYHDTNRPNHGPVWKTQSFLWSEIFMVILWQDCYGKGNLRKSCWSTGGRRFPNWECLFAPWKKDYSYLCLWMTSNWLERNKVLIRCGKYSTKKSMWANQHHSLIMKIWVALKENARQANILQTITGICSFESRISAGATEKLPFSGKLSVTWKVMPRNVWNDIVNWQTKQLNNFSRSQLHVLTTTNSKKKNWNPWENCQKYALKLFWSAYTWHVFEELIFYGRWTHLHDRSQNGPKLVTNDYPVWSLTFIIHVNTNNIVMWETLQNKADWDCFKTPILQESWGFKINFGENLVYLWKSHVCSNQLDV